MTHSFLGRPMRAAYFVFMAVILLTACEKENESQGLGLVPEESLLGLRTVTDSIGIDTYTVLADSARTNELSRALLGEVYHPDFGVTKTTVYCQVRLSALSVDLTDGGLAEDVVLDSLVLSLEYAETDSIYGIEEPMLFSVLELADALDLDSLYYSDDLTADLGEELLYSTNMVTPDLSDSTELYGLMYPKQLRLRLKDELGQRLIDESLSESTSFDGVDDFLEYFKGLKISATRGGMNGSILGLDLLSSQSRMTLYYHNSEEDSLSFGFAINESSQRYLGFEHDYLGTPVQTQLDDPSLREQNLYLQSMAGVNIEVALNTLQAITDTLQGAFNKVELVLPMATPMIMDDYDVPNRLFAVYEDETGDVISIPDIFEGDEHSGGYYDEDASEYRINITRFSQQAATGEISTQTLKVLPVSNAISPRWVQIHGVEHPMGGAKLVITYTKYE